MVNVTGMLKLIFRRQPIEKGNDSVTRALDAAVKRNAEAVAELKKVLAEGPRLKLVVEPPRRRDGRFAPATQRPH